MPVKTRRPREIEYPDSDGKPMAETPIHRRVMTDSIDLLDDWFASDPMVYVSGNMMMYYVEGDARRHLSPDVFVAFVAKKPERRLYLVWKEGKGPRLVIEISSKSTRYVDLKKKFLLYQDILKVQEYFLFDPLEEYLDPPLIGFRLRGGKYSPILAVKGRLPSQVTGLHLEAAGRRLQLYDPNVNQYLKTPREKEADAESALLQEREARLQAEAELERLREQLRRRNGKNGG